MGDLTVSVIDSNENWQKLAPEWNALLDTSASGSVFQTWEWLSSWAECCLGRHRSLFILAFYEKGHLVGIAPFYIERKTNVFLTLREIHFLGAPEAGSDYLDIFALKGRESDVSNALYDFLMGIGASAWDQLMLSEIPSDSLFLLHFIRRVQTEGKHAEIAYSSYCPVVNLHNVEGEFPAGISLGRKKKFKQELGILHRDAQVEHVVGRGGSSDQFEEFFRLYEKCGWSGEKLRLILHGFIHRYNGDNPVQIDMLSVNGQSIAGLLHLYYRNTLALYLMAVDKKFIPKLSLGNLLVGLCIKNSIVVGYDTYDFLRGEESYKFHWANEGNSTMQFTFWQKRPVAVTSALSRLVRHAGKVLLR